MDRVAHRIGLHRRARQGSVSVFFAFMLVFLFGAAGLAVDTARAYLGKAHLQNAADACALAAVGELALNPDPTTASARAKAAARLVVERHRVPYRAAPLTLDVDADLTVTPPDGTPAGVPRVTCRVAADGWVPFMLGVFGVGERTFDASASATLVASQSSCALPMGLKVLDTADAVDFGYEAGRWYPMHFGATDSASVPNFRWVEFDPDPSVTDVACNAVGLSKADEAACLVARGGKCDRPPPVASCSGAGVGCVAPVSGTGSDFEQGLGEAYNSRFGLYKAGGAPFTQDTSPPDYAGLAYDLNNWTECAAAGATCAAYVGGSARVGREAFAGAHATFGLVRNLVQARAAHESTQATSLDAALTPFYDAAEFSPSTVAVHESHGANRRVVVVPWVDAAAWAGGGLAPVRGYACVLLLNPWRGPAGSGDVQFEYLGNAASATSPCVASGLPGRADRGGPLVPALTP